MKTDNEVLEGLVGKIITGIISYPLEKKTAIILEDDTIISMIDCGMVIDSGVTFEKIISASSSEFPHEMGFVVYFRDLGTGIDPEDYKYAYFQAKEKSISKYQLRIAYKEMEVKPPN